MSKILDKETLTFDDVLLEPQLGLNSRDEADISTKIGTLSLKIPIISASMDSVTGERMALEMSRLGCGAILHRYMRKEDQFDIVKANPHSSIIPCFGTELPDKNWLGVLKDFTDTICLDIAHGHIPKMIESIQKLDDLGFQVIAGNVATAKGAEALFEAGAIAIKVGIGNGAVCTTRIQSGAGVPQLTAIMDCAKVANYHSSFVIADGGIRNPSDVVKSLAAGADCVMIGSYFAGTEESESEKIDKDGILYKCHRGMASREAQKESGKKVSPEGISTIVPYKGKVKYLVENIVNGLKSGMSYCGAKTLPELHQKAVFIKVSQATIRENQPHLIREQNSR